MRALRFPLWLLRTFGCDPSTNTLIGDLTEEHRAGKSVLWVWRQVIAGIVVSFLSAVRANPFLTVGGGALGWPTMLVLGWIVGYAAEWAVVVLQVYLPDVAPRQLLTTEGRYVFWNPLVSLLISSSALALTGLTLARVFGQRRNPAVLFFAITLVGFDLYRMMNSPELPTGAVMMAIPWWHPVVGSMTGWTNLLALVGVGIRKSNAV